MTRMPRSTTSEAEPKSYSHFPIGSNLHGESEFLRFGVARRKDGTPPKRQLRTRVRIQIRQSRRKSLDVEGLKSSLGCTCEDNRLAGSLRQPADEGAVRAKGA
jgi:hypothetical protein